MNLTICSVDYNNQAELNINYSLTKRLNPKSEFEWIRIQNAPLNNVDKAQARKNFTLINGVDPSEIQENEILKSRGSYHHALGLNLLKNLDIASDYLLIVDPDFFIIYPEWIKEVINYMRSNKLDVFGAPYDYRYFEKYRYFPSVWCCFIDLNKVDIQKVDWRPLNPYSYKISKLDHFWYYLFKNSNHPRIGLGRDGDTGARFFLKFHKETKNDILIPSAEKYIEKLAKKSNYDFLYPKRYRYLPKKKYYNLLRFSDFGLKEFDPVYSEQYFFKNKPFAYHIRFKKMIQKNAGSNSFDETLNFFNSVDINKK